MGKRGHPYFQISQARMQSISGFCVYLHSFFFVQTSVFWGVLLSSVCIVLDLVVIVEKHFLVLLLLQKCFVFFFFSYIPTVCKSWKQLHEPVRDSQRAGGGRLHALQAKPAGELWFFSILFTLCLWTCMEMVHCGMQISMSNILRKLA